MTLQRIITVNDQFTSHREELVKPLDEQFTDSWSYLSMDDFMTSKGIELRDQVR